MAEPEAVLECVPRWSAETLDDGKQERVQLQVSLPGVERSSDIVCAVGDDGRHLLVHVPGRYRAEIPLGTTVQSTADEVQFVQETALLRVSLRVATQQQEQQQPGNASAEPKRQQAAAPPMPPANQQRAGGVPAADAGLDPSAAPSGPVPSPREQLDAALYAAAKQHSNRGAAEECHARAQRLLRAGEATRAVRLLTKACQLDPENAAYTAALREAQQSAAASNANMAGQAGTAGSAAGAAGTAGIAGEEAASTSSRTSAQQQQGNQPQQDEHGQSTKQRRQERQRGRGQAEQAAPARRARPRPAGRRLLRIALSGILALAIQLAALYGLYAIAPAAAPPAESDAAAGGLRAVLGRAAALLLFLPRVLFWHPNWRVAGLWAVGIGAGCAALRTADHAQQARGRPDLVPSDVYVVGLIVAWHPLLWWACGGRWGAVLGTLGEALPIARLMGSSVWGHVAGYPLACLCLRLLVSPLLPYLATPAGYALAPPLWLLRLAVWQPRWWASLPAAGGLFYAALDAEKRPGGTPPGYWLQAFFLVAVWWLAGGGWWAVAHTLAYAASLSAVVLSADRHPALHNQLRQHYFFTPVPLFVARAAWCLIAGPVSVWALLTGGIAAIMLYLHVSRGFGSNASGAYSFAGRSGGAGQRSGGGGAGDSGATPVVHLHNTVPAGAPQAVARVLKAGNYYEVLGLAVDADEAAIRRAKRTLALATHPDKIGDAPGAAEAFNLVTEACEVLGDPASRQQYDRELQDAALSSGFNFSPEDLEASGIPPEWLDRMQEFMEAVEAGDIPQHCSTCGGLHFMRATDRPMAAARTCDECCTRHAVRENEVWFEAESAGFMRRTIRMFACYKGAVYDMSESAACEGTLQLIHERRFPLNKHVNFFKGFGLSSSGGGRGGAGAGGSKKGKPAQAAARNPPPRQQGPRGSSSKKKKGRR